MVLMTLQNRIHVVDFLHTLDIRDVPTACQGVSLGMRQSTSGSQQGDQLILLAQDFADFRTRSLLPRNPLSPRLQ